MLIYLKLNQMERITQEKLMIKLYFHCDPFVEKIEESSRIRNNFQTVRVRTFHSNVHHDDVILRFSLLAFLFRLLALPFLYIVNYI